MLAYKVRQSNVPEAQYSKASKMLYPFLPYSSLYLLYHIERTLHGDVSPGELLDYLQKESDLYEKWQISQDASENNHAARLKGTNLLYALALEVDPALLQFYLARGAENLDSRGGFFGTALKAAISCSNEDAVQILLQAGADVNITSGAYGSALHAAISIENGEKLLEMLFSTKADINIQAGLNESIPHAVTWPGKSKVVQMILYAGADVNARGGYYGCALQAAVAVFSHQGDASRHRFQPIIQMLLDAGADPSLINLVQATTAGYRKEPYFWILGGCRCFEKEDMLDMYQKHKPKCPFFT